MCRSMPLADRRVLDHQGKSMTPHNAYTIGQLVLGVTTFKPVWVLKWLVGP